MLRLTADIDIGSKRTKEIYRLTWKQRIGVLCTVYLWRGCGTQS